MLSASSDFKTKRICSLMLTHACNLNCVYCFEKFKNLGIHNMSFETAKSVISKELERFAKRERSSSDRFAIEFFGGEPFINFPVMKQVVDWVSSLQYDFPIMFQTTTNGTLLKGEIMDWITEHKDVFRVVISIDGDDAMQLKNRGCSKDGIPLDFIKDNWPLSYFKMTLSQETIPQFAHGTIELNLRGYKVPSSLAEGPIWTDEDHRIYKGQLLKLAGFYLDHPECQFDQPFNWSLVNILGKWEVPPRNCGVGVNVSIYDTDGRVFPCHLFLPVVHNDDGIEKILNEVDFGDDASLIDDICLKCKLKNICRTCYGYNMLDRGDVKNRNLSKCKMLLAEAQVVSSFQIQYFMSHKTNLTEQEKLDLRGAIECYKITHDPDFEFPC